MSAPWSARAKPQACRSWCGWVGSSNPARSPYLRITNQAVRRFRGCLFWLTKNALQAGFILARSAVHALISRSSSVCKGCVVESPFLRRATCRTRSSTSTRESSNEQASETSRPWRNIKKSRQRSRAACRPPLAASRSFSTSRVVRCFRSPFSKNGSFSSSLLFSSTVSLSFVRQVKISSFYSLKLPGPVSHRKMSMPYRDAFR